MFVKDVENTTQWNITQFSDTALIKIYFLIFTTGFQDFSNLKGCMDVKTCVQCINLPIIHTHYRKLSAPVFSLNLPLCIPGG